VSRANKVVSCPACRTPVEWSPASLFRPFCSKRCKLLDFGAWATERYRVTGPDHNEESAPSDGSNESESDLN